MRPVRRRRKAEEQSDLATLGRLYKKELPISRAKKQDLNELCKKLVIPKEYHYWYETIPSEIDVVDMTPVPDTHDSDVEDSTL